MATKVGNIRGPTGATGSTGATGPTGSTGAPGLGITWRGVWSNSIAYSINDAVQRTNQSYICTVANTANDPSTDTTHWSMMAGQGGDSTVVGQIIAWPSVTPPVGYLLCNGSAQSRATYAQLFSVVGITFGAGDGATTFNLPDLRSSMIIGTGQSPGLSNRILGASGGEETHALSVAELASHAHGVSHTHGMGNHTHPGVDHLHSMQNHTHGVDHYHSWSAQGSHTHGLGDSGHNHYANGINHAMIPSGSGGGTYDFCFTANNGTAYNPVTSLNNQTASGLSVQAAATPAGNTVYASQTNAAWANSGGPSVASTGAADRGLTTGGPSTNTTDDASIANTVAAGSGTAHNNMSPFVVLTYCIRATYSVAVVGTTVPIADTTQPGLLRKVSGLTTDFIDGTNNCSDLASVVKLVAPVVRSYNSIGNPNFECDARTAGAGASGTVGGWAMDRWSCSNQSAGTAAFSTKQIAAPGGVVIAGTNYCVSGSFLRIQVTAAQSTLAATDRAFIIQYIEGPRLRELLGGQTAITIVARSSVAGVVIGMFLQDPTPSYTYNNTFTIPNANAWTAITIPNIPTWPAGATFPITSGANGYIFGIGLLAGTTFMGPSNGVWNAGNWKGALGQQNLAALPLNSTIDFAIVQHEPGGTPNGILDKDFQTNLVECARYFQKTYDLATAVNAIVNPGMVGGTSLGTAIQIRPGITFTVRMARVPVVTVYSTNIAGANLAWNITAGTSPAVSTTSNVGESGYAVNASVAPAASSSWQFHHVADTTW